MSTCGRSLYDWVGEGVVVNRRRDTEVEGSHLEPRISMPMSGATRPTHLTFLWNISHQNISPYLFLHSSQLPSPSDTIMSGRGYRGRGRGRGGGSNTRFTGKRSSFRPSKPGGGVAYGIDRPAPAREDDGNAALERFEEVKVQDEIDQKMGFWRFDSHLAAGEKRVGWLVNMHQVRTAWIGSC